MVAWSMTLSLSYNVSVSGRRWGVPPLVGLVLWALLGKVCGAVNALHA